MCDFDTGVLDEESASKDAQELSRKYNFERRVIGINDKKQVVFPKDKACSKIEGQKDLNLHLQMVQRELEIILRKNCEQRDRNKAA